ncbi:uncharacterized protein METZ01_LOCUS431116, partial [marine metagenome]
DSDFNLLDYSVDVSPATDQNMFTVSLSVDVSSAVTSVDATLDNGAGSVVDLVLNSDNDHSVQTQLGVSPAPHTISLLVHLSSGGSYSFENLDQKIMTWFPFIISGDQVIYDNLSDDGELNIGDLAHVSLTVTNDSDHEIEELIAMVLDVEGPIDYYDDPYLSFGHIDPAGNASSSIFTGEDGHVTIKVSESAEEGDTLSLALRFFDLLGNIWEEEYQLYIQDNEGISDFTEMEHPGGSADGSFTYRVVRPEDITGHQYQISFSEYT